MLDYPGSRLEKLKKMNSIKYGRKWRRILPDSKGFVQYKIGHVTLRLTDAKLCLNCDAIFIGAISCPVCTSGQWEWLCRWVPPLQSRRQPTIATAANAQETEVPE